MRFLVDIFLLFSTALLLFFLLDLFSRKHQQEQNKLRSILETAVDAIITIDTEGKIQSFNQAAEKIFGYKQEEVIGKPIEILMPDEYAKHHQEYIRRYLETGEKKIIGIGREVEGKRKDQSIFPMYLAVSEVKDKGKVILFTGIIRDLTLLKEYEKKLLEQNQELKQFLYILSHDLKEPIRSIQGFTSLLIKRYSNKLPKEGKEFLEYILSSSKRMHQLIEDLLHYSQVSTSPKKQTFLLDKAYKEALENLKILIKEYRAEITPSSLPPIKVWGNPTQIALLFQNLISNGIKFHKPQKKPKIHIEIEEEKNHYLIKIHDNGVGIPRSQQKRIFDLFYQGDTSQEGSGIGLAICKKIVQNHGGKIGVSSTKGKGSTFYFTLPKGK